MANEDDKYPASSGRRRFVKGVVGSAALAGVGTATAAMVDQATERSGQGGGQTTYFGVENTAGPAPRAMPQIPIEIDDEGYLRGVYPTVEEVERQGETVTVARQQLGGVEYEVDWFQYCGVQSYAGLSPSYSGDNYFRYGDTSSYQWMSESVSTGDRVNVSEFEDYEEWGNDIGRSGLGKPAVATWRSQNVQDTIPVQIIRSARIEQMAESGGQSEWLSASTQQGFIAILNKCTHFCCVPGFKQSAQSTQFGGADAIYCPCHQSIYDPFSIVKRSFVAYPRPEDSGSGGGGGGGGGGGSGNSSNTGGTGGGNTTGGNTTGGGE